MKATKTLQLDSYLKKMLVSELIPNYVFHCTSLHLVSVFLHALLNHLGF